MVAALLESLFPGLQGKSWQITSSSSRGYNCIAWARGDASTWCWPTPTNDPSVTWPMGLPRDERVTTFSAMFARDGYVTCHDASLEAGHEKIALFATANGEVTHAARQLANGMWTSKLGELEDIEHELHDVEGAGYGQVTLILKRTIVGS